MFQFFGCQGYLIKLVVLRAKPTIDDLRAARDEFDVQQKRVNRAYANKLKWAAIWQRQLNWFIHINSFMNFIVSYFINNFYYGD